MASETPDPSSSELLTDFDIADVDNWDDQNDNSKDIELVKTAASYISSPNIPHFNSVAQCQLTGQLPLKLGTHSDVISSMDHLNRFQSTLMSPSLQNPPSLPSQQQATGHDYAKISSTPKSMQGISEHNPAVSAAEQSKPAKAKPVQTGQALETLRALALAQEEQAKKMKQDQEQAAQLQQQLKSGASCSHVGETNTASPQRVQSPTIASPGVQTKQVSIPITNLKGQGGKPNSVLQLRGQLIRTPDQKLMLVTELAGKKVGYLISPQSGQIQAANPTIATQLAGKAIQSSIQAQAIPKQDTVLSAASSPVGYVSQNNTQALSNQGEESRTILDSIEDSSNDGYQPSLTRQESVVISSDEDSNSIAGVASNLKNTHIGGGSVPEKKKRKGKAKKKKDKNEPVKPISPYLMFFKDVQPSVRQENPGAGLGEVSKMVSKLWEQLDKEQKQAYLDRSAKAKEEYQIKLAEYKANIAAASPAASSQNHTASSPIDEHGPQTETNGSFQDRHPSNQSEAALGKRVGNIGNDSILTTVVSSPESAPERSSTSLLESSGNSDAPGTNVEEENSMDVEQVPSEDDSSASFTVDGSTVPVEEPVVRKRGRPKSSKRNGPTLNLPRAKKGKRKEKIDPPEQEKPLKLTMKINIKDSKITESPTKAFVDLEEDTLDERLQADEDDEDMTAKEDEDEKKPSTQPKALLTFKIPKKQRSSVEERDDVKKENPDKLSQPSTSGFRKCVRPVCDQAAKINKERGPMYCTNKCLVLHCRSVFETWVDERRKDSNKE